MSKLMRRSAFDLSCLVRFKQVILILLSLVAVVHSVHAEIRSSENHKILSDGLVVAAGASSSVSFKLFSIVGSGQPNGALTSTNFALRGGAISVVSVVDNDNDGVLNEADNCSLEFNPTQENSDTDPLGDACDEDDDGDDVPDFEDNCQFEPNNDQRDTDTDGFGDVCDLDDDDDGQLDDDDNCPLAENPDQADTDGDGIGDVCDADELCFPIKLKNQSAVLVCL